MANRDAQGGASPSRDSRRPATPPRRDLRVVRAWLAVLVWVACVWTLGGDEFPSTTTSRFMRPFVEWLLPWLSTADLVQIVRWLRKSAHAVEYGLLAILMLRALWLGTRLSLPAAIFATMIPLTALAAADEARQSLSSVRTGSGWDIALDFTGGSVALIAVILLNTWLRVPILPRIRGRST